MYPLNPVMLQDMMHRQMAERCAQAERMRLLRVLDPAGGMIPIVRSLTGRLLVRAGEWVIPPMPAADEPKDHIPVRMAR